MELPRAIVYWYHLLLWSSFSVVEWFSKKDSVLAKIILLLVFFYLSYLVAYNLIKTRRGAFLVSVSTLLLYIVGRQLFIIAMK